MTIILQCSNNTCTSKSKSLQRRTNPNYSWNSLADDLRHEERFRLTWLVLYVLRIWGTIRFFIAVANDYSTQAQEVDKVLIYFQSIGDSGQAFCNFLIFCVFDKRVVSRLRLKCNKGNESSPLLTVNQTNTEA